MKLSMARASPQGAWITSKTHGKTELNVNRLTTTLFSTLTTRLQQATQTINAIRAMDGQSMTWVAKHPQ